MDLNHLYLLVRDVDRSVAFYRDHFGFDRPSEWQGETFLIRNADGFSLALTLDPQPPAWPRGLHFGFLLDSTVDASSLRERIAEAAGSRCNGGLSSPRSCAYLAGRAASRSVTG